MVQWNNGMVNGVVRENISYCNWVILRLRTFSATIWRSRSSLSLLNKIQIISSWLKCLRRRLDERGLTISTRIAVHQLSRITLYYVRSTYQALVVFWSRDIPNMVIYVHNAKIVELHLWDNSTASYSHKFTNDDYQSVCMTKVSFLNFSKGRACLKFID